MSKNIFVFALGLVLITLSYILIWLRPDRHQVPESTLQRRTMLLLGISFVIGLAASYITH